MRRLGLYGMLLLGLLSAGCGDDAVEPCTQNCGGDPGGGGGGPFVATEVFLRPLSIQRPVVGAPPAPEIAAYHLSAFYQGGQEPASFDWTVPPALGTVVPKAPTLTVHDATVLLKLPDAGNLPLGIYGISAAGTSGTETGTVHHNFAVVEFSWMKHVRTGWQMPEPEDPVQWPTFMLTTSGEDSIIMVEGPSVSTTRLRRIPASFPLALANEPIPAGVILFPTTPDPNNYDTAQQTTPDVAPAALGRREVLFSSTMDSQFDERCPDPAMCGNTPPFNIWVVAQPSGIVEARPRPMTFDSTYVQFGQRRWRAYFYAQPRWDPSSTGADARIAFVSNLAADSSKANLWTAVARDRDADARTDTLVNYVRLTSGGGIASFDWHPDGTRLCAATRRGLAWIDASTGAATPLAIPDHGVERPARPAVFWRPGEHTFVVFEAQQENLSNLYLLDVEDNSLVRLLPFSVPITHNMFPRWHRDKKWIVYVSDYTVMRWGNSTPGAGHVPDLLNPLNPNFDGMPRTRFPSPWVLKLE